MYAWEKYHLASEGLTSSSLPPQKALEDAYVFHIMHVQEHDVPPELWPEVQRVQNAVTLPESVDPIGGHSGCNYAISYLSDEQVHELITQIHDTYQSLNCMYKAGQLDDSA